MNQEIEVIPVTAEEIIWLLGALTYDEMERILDDIKALRKERIFNKILVLVNNPKNVR
ncbi:hypothetical protein KEJ18_05100 [Candidatus Bathyarchaeota archaeon]|nr:hypothetical protein [Candidatus Bathyarchaeota archaeon]